MNPTEQTHILIVDDEKAVGTSLKIWLEGEGFSAYYAQDLDQSLDILKKNPITVALVDLRLKSIDGIFISERLKEWDEHIQIIMLTGFPSYETAVKAMKSGVFDYMSKGASNTDILDAIQKAVRKRAEYLLDQQNLIDEEKVVKFVLVCKHSLIVERLRNFSKGSKKIRLARVFQSLEHLQDHGVPEGIHIVLIYETCIPQGAEETMAFFSKLKSLMPGTKTIVISERIPEDRKAFLLKLGIHGFYPVELSTHKLEEALLQVKDGEIWAGRKIMSRAFQSLVESGPGASLPKTPGVDFGLTAREIDVLRAMVKGQKNRQIADDLIISELTVKTHVNRILKKLGVDNRSKAILKAVKHHLV